MGHTQLTRVDETNLEQAKAWDGDEGDYWARHAERFDTSVAAYHAHLFDTVQIRATDAVLDLGCGTGQTTRDAARRAIAGFALGVDLSTRMLDVARRLAETEGVPNAHFLRADAQVHPFEPAAFDVAISRTGAMFFGDQAAAFANIARALRPGGQLALLVWQGPERNDWMLAFGTAMAAGRNLSPPPVGAQGPFGLSDPDLVRDVLTGAGFTEPRFEDLTAPMWFGPDPDDATAFIGGLLAWMVADLDEAGRARALDALNATMVLHSTPRGVELGSAMWLVTAVRRG